MRGECNATGSHRAGARHSVQSRGRVQPPPLPPPRHARDAGLPHHAALLSQQLSPLPSCLGMAGDGELPDRQRPHSQAPLSPRRAKRSLAPRHGAPCLSVRRRGGCSTPCCLLRRRPLSVRRTRPYRPPHPTPPLLPSQSIPLHLISLSSRHALSEQDTAPICSPQSLSCHDSPPQPLKCNHCARPPRRWDLCARPWRPATPCPPPFTVSPPPWRLHICLHPCPALFTFV